MNTKPLKGPLPDEHVLQVEPPLQPSVQAGWQSRPNLYTGRALSAEALASEQLSHSGRFALRGQMVAPGVVSGLGVRLDSYLDPITRQYTHRFIISPGLGIASSGEDVLMPRALRVRVDQIPAYWQEHEEGPIDFDLSVLSNAKVADTHKGLKAAVLMLVPLVSKKDDPPNPNNLVEPEPDDYSFEDWRLVDGCALVLYAWPKHWPMPKQDPDWRNRLAWMIFDYERQRPHGQFAPWEQVGVPLALIGFQPPANATETATPIFSDRASVVRPGGAPRSRTPLVDARGNPLLWQARSQQFAEHIAGFSEQQLQNGSALSAFAFLPPIGSLPKSAIDLFEWRHRFFPASFVLEALPVPIEQLDALSLASAALMPLDTSLDERLRVLVPIPEAHFDPFLLQTELLDPAFPQAISSSLQRLGEWRRRRRDLRAKSTLLLNALEGRKTGRYPDPDPAAIPGEYVGLVPLDPTVYGPEEAAYGTQGNIIPVLEEAFDQWGKPGTWVAPARLGFDASHVSAVSAPESNKFGVITRYEEQLSHLPYDGSWQGLELLPGTHTPAHTDSRAIWTGDELVIVALAMEPEISIHIGRQTPNTTEGWEWTQSDTVAESGAVRFSAVSWGSGRIDAFVAINSVIYKFTWRVDQASPFAPPVEVHSGKEVSDLVALHEGDGRISLLFLGRQTNSTGEFTLHHLTGVHVNDSPDLSADEQNPQPGTPLEPVEVEQLKGTLLSACRTSESRIDVLVLRPNADLEIQGIYHGWFEEEWKPASPERVSQGTCDALQLVSRFNGRAHAFWWQKVKASSTATIMADGAPVGTMAAKAAGSRTLTPTTALADGSRTVRATATDTAGTTNPSFNTNTFIVGTMAPAAPVAVTPANGSSTNDTTPTYSGTSEPNSTVTVIVDGVRIGTTTANATGNWTLTPTAPLENGSHSVSATATDAAGATSPNSNTNTFTVDTTAPAAPVVVTPANGSSTNDTTPTYSGTAEPNSTVTVIVDGVSVGTTITTATGTWSFTPTTTLVAGQHSVRTTARDAAGTTSPSSNTNSFTVDTTAPAAPVVVTPANGSSTNDTTPTYSGTAEPNSTVTVIVDGAPVGTMATNATGNWSFTPVVQLANGPHTVRVTATDAAGNTSPSSNTHNFAVDTTAPAAPVVVTPANGSGTNDSTPTYSGTAEPNSTVTVIVDGVSVGTTTANAAGNWTLTPATALVDGPHTVIAVAADPAGNTSPSSNTNAFTVDATAPAAPVVVTPANGSVTNDNTPTYMGTAEANSTVTVIVDGVPVGTTTANAAGNWTLTPATARPDGPHTVRATSSDAVGNTSPSSNTNTFTVDTTAPTAPVVLTPANSSLTNDSTPMYSGTAEPNSTVTVIVNGVSVGTTTANASGAWSFTPSTALVAGPHSVRATATDAAGNTSLNSNTNTFTLDITPPAAPVVTKPPNGSATPDTTPIYAGTAEPGSTVAVIVDGTSVGTTTASAAGTWSFTLTTGLVAGPHSVRVTATDAAGNTSPNSNTNSFTVINTTPEPQEPGPLMYSWFDGTRWQLPQMLTRVSLHQLTQPFSVIFDGTAQVDLFLASLDGLQHQKMLADTTRALVETQGLRGLVTHLTGLLSQMDNFIRSGSAQIQADTQHVRQLMISGSTEASRLAVSPILGATMVKSPLAARADIESFLTRFRPRTDLNLLRLPDAIETLDQATTTRATLTRRFIEFVKELDIDVTGMTLQGVAKINIVNNKKVAALVQGTKSIQRENIPVLNLVQDPAQLESALARIDEEPGAIEQALLVFPVADRWKESEYFATSVQHLENVLILLRELDRRSQRYERSVEAYQQALVRIEAFAAELDKRLKFVDGEVAEARQDVTVARSLMAEELLRLDAINQRRRRIFDEHVPFLVFQRPRERDLTIDSPARVLDPGLARNILPEVFASTAAAPSELLAYMELVRDSPLKWFSFAPQLLRKLDRVEYIHRTFVRAQVRAVRRVPIQLPLPKGLPASRFFTGLSRIVDAREALVAQWRQPLVHFEHVVLERQSWIELQQSAHAQLSLDDLIDMAHGRAEVGRTAAAELERISKVATGLYQRFGEVLPVIRLEWAEQMSQYDGPVELRDLSRLPNWDRIDVTDRREMQTLVDWLFQRVVTQEPEAVSLMNDLVRLCMLLASHAPVNELISGHVSKPSVAKVGGTLELAVDPSRVRVGMHVQINSGGQLVQAVVDDLSTSVVRARVLSTTAPTVQLKTTDSARFSDPARGRGVLLPYLGLAR
jgi:hypothetical protein